MRNARLWRTLLGVEKTVIETMEMDDDGGLVFSVRATVEDGGDDWTRDRFGSNWKPTRPVTLSSAQAPAIPRRSSIPEFSALRRMPDLRKRVIATTSRTSSPEPGACARWPRIEPSRVSCRFLSGERMRFMPKKFPAEVRDRAVRMTLDRLSEYRRCSLPARPWPRSWMSVSRRCASGWCRPRSMPESRSVRRVLSLRRSGS